MKGFTLLCINVLATGKIDLHASQYDYINVKQISNISLNPTLCLVVSFIGLLREGAECSDSACPAGGSRAQGSRAGTEAEGHVGGAAVVGRSQRGLDRTHHTHNIDLSNLRTI